MYTDSRVKLHGVLIFVCALDDFGRLYAIYGGVFIGLSFAWGAVVDGMTLDRGDLVGSAIAMVGVCVILFWRPGDDDGDAGPEVTMAPTPSI